MNYGVEGLELWLNGNRQASCDTPQPRAERPLYLGDFPSDSIEESMIGFVNELEFSYALTDDGQTWDEVLQTRLFTDVPDSDPDLKAFQALKAAGIMEGSNGWLYPDVTLNRAEMVKLLLSLFDEPVGEQRDTNFWDVDSSAWYAAYVKRAEDIGMIQGQSQGRFGPADAINQAELFTMLARVDNVDLSSETEPYWDVRAEDWFQLGARYAASKDLAPGLRFSPEKNLTRRDTARILYRLLNE
jgi:hypothetical protein